MKKFKYILLSFIIPFAIAGVISAIAFIACGAGVTANDCYEQYVPFFNVYYDILKSGGSMFYSLKGSMGFDFYAVFSYYLVSPLNFLILLGDKSDIIYWVNIIIIIKMGLCGASFAGFITHRFKNLKGSRIVLFSTIYALCGFTTGYCWNVMWLDGVLMFPLVIMGLDLLMQKDKPRWILYTLLLAAEIILSYFVGYMSCIFIFMYFFTYDFEGIADFGKKFLKIGLSSILAIGISAIILVPSFGGVQSTYISGEVLPKAGFYGSYAESFKTFLFTVPQNGICFSRENANLFMTSLGLFLAMMYMTAGKIKISSKIRNAVLVAVLLFSFNFRPFNFIWHGLHEQTGIPNRFSFMVTFMLLVMGIEVCTLKKHEIKFKSAIISVALLAAGLAVLVWFDRSLLWHAVVTFMLIVFYFAIFMFVHGAKKFRIISCMAYAEIIIMFVVALFNSSSNILGDFDYYLKDFQLINQEKEAGYYREKIDETYNENEQYFENEMDYPDSFSPSVILEYCRFMRNIGHLSIVNEDAVYGINSMSLFNTFNNYTQTLFYCRTGATGGTNNCMYYGENPFMDMLLGVKYYYTRYSEPRSCAYEYKKITGNVRIYENKYALSTGYAIPQKLVETGIKYSDNPFITMNNISKMITGEAVNEVITIPLTLDCDSKDGTKTYTLEAEHNKELLIEPCAGNLKKYEVFVNDEKIYESNRNQCVIDVGTVKKGDVVKVILTLKEPKDVTASLYAAYLDQEVLENTYSYLKNNEMDIIEYSDTYIKGYVNLPSDEDILITIPYMKGWTVYVDGEKQDAELFSELFYCVSVKNGKHYIEMKYETPGFKLGMIISIVSMLITILAFILDIYFRKNNKETDDADDPFFGKTKMTQKCAQELNKHSDKKEVDEIELDITELK